MDLALLYKASQTEGNKGWWNLVEKKVTFGHSAWLGCYNEYLDYYKILMGYKQMMHEKGKFVIREAVLDEKFKGEFKCVNANTGQSIVLRKAQVYHKLL